MLTSVDKNIARELRRRFSTIVTVVDFRIYGSRARGDATDESDFDVYLVVDSVTNAQRRRIDEVAWEVGFDCDRVIATIVATTEQIEHGPFGANPLLRIIERDGIQV